MKHNLIIFLGLLGGISLAGTVIKPVKAIPIVDSFDTNETHNISISGSNDVEAQAQDTDTGSISIIGNDPTDTGTNGERDIFLEATTGSGSATSEVLSGGVSGEGYKFSYEQTTSGFDPKSSLTYDGEDGNPNNPKATTSQGDFRSQNGLNNINVRTDINGKTNNVFTLKNVEVTGDLDIDIRVELFSGNDPSTSSVFSLAPGTSGDISIALTESDITAGGIDTDGRFFDATNTFDFTNVTGVLMETSITASGTNQSGMITVQETTFERIPFEVESSLGIALLGTWGAWKRWKRKRKERTDETSTD